MGKITTWADLFDFSNPADVDKAIKALTALNAEYNKLIKAASNSASTITASQQKIIDSINQMQTATGRLDEARKKDQKVISDQNAQLQALTASYKKLSTELNKANSEINKLAAEKAKVSKATKDLNGINEKAIALEAQIGKLTGVEAKEIAGLNVQLQNLKKQRTQEAKDAAGMISLYQKESQKLGEIARKYKDLVIAGKENSTVAKQLKRDHDALRATIIKADQSVGQYSRTVGNYKTALNGIKSLASAFGIVGGAMLIADIARNTFELIKETERYSKALKQVTDSSKEYKAEMSFLLDLSNRYGVNVNTLTGAYTQFFVATKGTKVAGEQTRFIFDTVTEASAKMGLTMADTEGVLKALGQMMSKGKVQAEELRGQLGDRLSGSFKIMAKAIGVTTAELDKMLKDGNVIAEDVLPKFAAQMQKTFNLEQSASIDTIAASQNRLTNAWIEFIRGLEDGSGAIAQAIKGLFDLGSGFIHVLSAINGSADKDIIGNYFQEITDKGGSLKDELSKIEAQYDKLNIKRKAGLPISLKEGETLEWLAKHLLIGNELLQEQIDLKEKQAEAEKESWLETHNSNMEAYKSALLTDAKSEALKLYNDAVKNGIYTNGEFENTLYDTITAMDSSNAIFEEAELLYKDNARELAHLIYLKRLDEDAEKKRTATIKKLQKELYDNQLIKTTLSKELAYQEFKEKQRLAQLEGSELAQIADNTLNSISQAIDDETAKKKAASEEAIMFAQLEHDKKVLLAQSVGSAIGIIGNQLFTNSQINRDNELKDFEEKTQAQIDLAGNNAAQKERLEKQLDDKRRANQLEQAKAQKRQALFNVALSTAQAVISIWAQVPKYDFGISAGVLSGYAIGLGAIEAAAIASQPLPKYEKGGKTTSDTIITSEKGREMAITPDGRLILTGNKGAEVRRDIPKGSEILTNTITERLISQGVNHTQVNDDSAVKIMKILNEQRDKHTIELVNKLERENDLLMRTFSNAMDKMRVDNWHITDGDLKRSSRKGNTTYTNWREQNAY